MNSYDIISIKILNASMIISENSIIDDISIVSSKFYNMLIPENISLGDIKELYRAKNVDHYDYCIISESFNIIKTMTAKSAEFKFSNNNDTNNFYHISVIINPNFLFSYSDYIFNINFNIKKYLSFFYDPIIEYLSQDLLYGHEYIKILRAHRDNLIKSIVEKIKFRIEYFESGDVIFIIDNNKYKLAKYNYLLTDDEYLIIRNDETMTHFIQKV